MERLRHALMRLGEPRLQELVGHEVVKYLELLGEPISATRLADVLIGRWGFELLSAKHSKVREELLIALPRTEAARLEELVTGSSSSSPWATLLHTDFDSLDGRLPLLFQFFGVDLPPAKEPEPKVPDRETICGAYPLYPYQARTIERAILKLEEGDRRALIHMPTGSGKTRCAMALIAQLLRTSASGHVVLWLAHSEELCDQAAEEFTKCWSIVGERPVELGRFYGDHELNLNELREGIVVAGLAKLYSRSLSQQGAFLALKGRVRLVVMDEAHQALAPTYQHLLQMLAPVGGACRLLGLSATPGRSWIDVDQDARLAAFFARKKVVLETPSGIDPVSFLQSEGYLAVPDYRLIPYKPSVVLTGQDVRSLAEGLDLSVETVRKLGDDAQRNLLIISEVLTQVDAGARILLFACSVEHAVMLADTLAAKGVRAASLSSVTSPERRAQILQSFKRQEDEDIQLVANFAILTTGFDAPKTNVVVVARPTQSVVLYSQMIGRAMRGPRSGGNERCTVITVKDQLPGFRSIYEGFAHWEDVW